MSNHEFLQHHGVLAAPVELNYITASSATVTCNGNSGNMMGVAAVLPTSSNPVAPPVPFPCPGQPEGSNPFSSTKIQKTYVGRLKKHALTPGTLLAAA